MDDTRKTPPQWNEEERKRRKMERLAEALRKEVPDKTGGNRWKKGVPMPDRLEEK